MLGKRSTQWHHCEGKGREGTEWVWEGLVFLCPPSKQQPTTQEGVPGSVAWRPAVLWDATQGEGNRVGWSETAPPRALEASPTKLSPQPPGWPRVWSRNGLVPPMVFKEILCAQLLPFEPSYGSSPNIQYLEWLRINFTLLIVGCIKQRFFICLHNWIYWRVKV